jgi:hypothetical protein
MDADSLTDAASWLAHRKCHDLNLHLGGRIVNFLRNSLADTGNIVVPFDGTLLQ